MTVDLKSSGETEREPQVVQADQSSDGRSGRNPEEKGFVGGANGSHDTADSLTTNSPTYSTFSLDNRQACNQVHDPLYYHPYNGPASPPDYVTSQSYTPTSPIYSPVSPTYTPTTPEYIPASPVYDIISYTYSPTPPEYILTYSANSPAYNPGSPAYSQTSSPSFRAFSPSFLANMSIPEDDDNDDDDDDDDDVDNQ